ncbi:MAG: PQQ-binding-like beta-propeller repeat protein [Thermoanaerobaculia bacterium]|nr:PQQ-binding-like beta-propeller repeat protein [Thermoanaerobaculia bacterium]
MTRPETTLTFLAVALATVAALSAPGAAAGVDWPWWGGPNGDFTVEATGLAEAWPEDGPRELWRRALGEGYSAITVVGDRLYTMYRRGETEIVVALAAASGDTIWETEYDSPTDERDWSFDRGPGPHATPAVHAGRVFAVGSTNRFHALEAETGEVLWSYDFLQDFDGSFRHRGYSASPLVYRDTVIIPVGGSGQGVMAFRQADGEVVWKAGDDDASYASPILIDLDGETQVAAFAANEIVGIDPDSGRFLWSHPHPTRGAFNISTPLWSADDRLLFASSAYDGGGRVLRLSGTGTDTRVEELWFSNQVRIHFGTAIRIGDTVYASSGDFGPAPMKAVDIATGDVLWQDRSFAKHSLVHADGKLVLLDEDGVLGLLRVDRDGVEVLARAQVFDSLSWTVPTLVGTKLYARNREEIVALELGGR